MTQIYKEKRAKTRPRFMDDFQNWIEECINEAVQKNENMHEMAKILEELLKNDSFSSTEGGDQKFGKIKKRIEAGMQTAIHIIKAISLVIPEVVKRDLGKDVSFEERKEILQTAYTIVFKIAMMDTAELLQIMNKMDNGRNIKKYFKAVEKKGKIVLLATDDFWRENVIRIHAGLFAPHMGCPAHVNFAGESFIKLIFQEY